MTKEEIKNRANNLHIIKYRGIDCVTLTCATAFAEHIADSTMKETLETVCKCLGEMTVVPECIIYELYKKAKIIMLEK